MENRTETPFGFAEPFGEELRPGHDFDVGFALAGHGPGQEGFARAGRSREDDAAARVADAHLGEQVGMGERQFDHVPNRLDRLVLSDDIGVGNMGDVASGRVEVIGPTMFPWAGRHVVSSRLYFRQPEGQRMSDRPDPGGRAIILMANDTPAIIPGGDDIGQGHDFFNDGLSFEVGAQMERLVPGPIDLASEAFLVYGQFRAIEAPNRPPRLFYRERIEALM